MPDSAKGQRNDRHDPGITIYGQPLGALLHFNRRQLLQMGFFVVATTAAGVAADTLLKPHDPPDVYTPEHGHTYALDALPLTGPTVGNVRLDQRGQAVIVKAALGEHQPSYLELDLTDSKIGNDRTRISVLDLTATKNTSATLALFSGSAGPLTFSLSGGGGPLDLTINEKSGGWKDPFESKGPYIHPVDKSVHGPTASNGLRIIVVDRPGTEPVIGAVDTTGNPVGFWYTNGTHGRANRLRVNGPEDPRSRASIGVIGFATYEAESIAMDVLRGTAAQNPDGTPESNVQRAGRQLHEFATSVSHAALDRASQIGQDLELGR